MSTLILVPTQLEMNVVRNQMTVSGDGDEFLFELCGFGPIAAAARTAALLARHKPDRVMLIGIAGSYTERLPVGSAHRFGSTACDGVGVGAGRDFISAGELGWPQFNCDSTAPKVGDLLVLDSAYVGGIPEAGLLVSCCSASANKDEARWRMSRFPNAVAEDMEGFSVALACSLASRPVQIVRGISNQVGNRDHGSWRIDDALSAAAKLACQLLPESWKSTP